MRNFFVRTGALGAGALLMLLTPACSKKEDALRASPRSTTERALESGRPAEAAGSAESRRAALLNKIRSSDPRKETIETAVINARNELGLVLSRRTNLDDVPRLVQSMLTEMSRSFPGEDLTVLTYTPTEPRRLIGTGRLNAQTREMYYTPAAGQ